MQLILGKDIAQVQIQCEKILQESPTIIQGSMTTGNRTNNMEEITMEEAVTLLEILIDSHPRVPMVTLGVTSMQMKIDIVRD